MLDSEIMPWSLKAQELLSDQYAAVGAAARTSLKVAESLLRQTAARGIEVADTLHGVEERLGLVELYSDAYARYCWPVESLADIQLAPFHLLASEGQLHTDKDHLWHMSMAVRLHAADPVLFRNTRHKVVRLNTSDEADATVWWEDMTSHGSEGMVVKPLNFVPRGKRGLTQPAMKCRGAEYLRIIYGPEYTLPENLERLRDRNISAKRVSSPSGVRSGIGGSPAICGTRASLPGT